METPSGSDMIDERGMYCRIDTYLGMALWWNKKPVALQKWREYFQKRTESGSEQAQSEGESKIAKLGFKGIVSEQL